MANIINDVDTSKSDMELLETGLDDKQPEIVEKKVKAPTVDDEPDDINENEVDEDNGSDVDPDEESEEEIEGEDKPVLPHERPTLTDIKKEYPEFFKKFPALRDMMYREQEYTTLFPTVEDAKEAQAENESFINLRNDIFQGDGKSFVSALKDSDGLEKFSNNFLDNLAQSDKEVHWKVISPVLQNAARAAYRAGIKSGNENLAYSAQWFADYLFGAGGIGKQVDPEIVQVLEGKRSVVPETKKEEKPPVNKELNDWKIERAQNFSNDVNVEVQKSIETEIDKGLTDRGLSKIEIKALRQEILDEVVKNIAADKRHMGYIDSMWKNAIKNGFKPTDKSSLISASLARASSLIPSVRRRLLTEALKESKSEGIRQREVVDKVNSRREPGNSGRPSRSSNGSVPSAKAVDWKKTSDMDFLSGNFKTK